jgi:hypothetical protein
MNTAVLSPIVTRDGAPAVLSFSPAERDFLFELQRQALRYFLDNQVDSGLILDRQRNHDRRRPDGLCSLAATGMGFIALALASASPYRLLTPGEAVERIGAGLRTALLKLPHDHGAMPHFVDALTFAVFGTDYLSTIESAWMVAGALWAAAFLRDRTLHTLADHLYDRFDFRFWTAPDLPGACGQLRHGMDSRGRFLPFWWDRLNGETVFMYLLAAGAAEERALSPLFWPTLSLFYGEVAGSAFNNAGLGLFVFQYGLDLLDAREWREPGGVDLAEEARLATMANERACRALAGTHRTYARYWGLSAGDGPNPGGPDAYRCYSPAGPIDGTAHLTATVAGVAHHPGAVLENLYQAQHDRNLRVRGRYGFSNVNLGENWVSRDVVGIDAGAAVLALDNALMDNRVRSVFHDLLCVQRGLDRLGFRKNNASPVGERAPQRRAG